MKKKVNIICNWLLDEKTLNLTMGGSQRYVLELTKLFVENGFDVKIYQKSFEAFKTEILDGIVVEGIRTTKNWLGLIEFSYKTRKKIGCNELTIYVYQESSFPFVVKNSIAIQHGLNWSGSNRIVKYYNTFLLQPYILRRLKSIVCVDTAYINWVHTQINGNKKYQEKLLYIPNFVENKKHTNKAKWIEEDLQKVVLFPRRMVKHRGALFAYEAMKILWERGKTYKIVFCGHGPLTKQIMENAKKHDYQKYIDIYERSFDEMPNEYANAQVAIIPTLAFEGTSLSCIEAMSSGLPVIVTHIGGLGNIVVPEFNGACINLNIKEMANEIEDLLSDKTRWNMFSENGIITARSLDIETWRSKWSKILDI